MLADVGVKGAGAINDEAGRPASRPRVPAQQAQPAQGASTPTGGPEFARQYRELQEHLDNPADRLAVMDSQGIESAVNFAALPGIEVRVRGRLRGPLRQPQRPQPLPGRRVGLQLREPALHPAVHLLRRPRDGAEAARGDHEGSRSPRSSRPRPARRCTPRRSGPENDRFWSICSEAGIKLATHLASVTRYARPGRGLERGRGDAGRHGRLPVGLLLRRPSRHGDGRRRHPAGLVRALPQDEAPPLRAGHGVGALPDPQDGPRLPHGPAGHVGQARPSDPADYFKEHCFVAPFPEENVDRVVEVVGTRADRVRLRLPPRRGPARADRRTSASSRT